MYIKNFSNILKNLRIKVDFEVKNFSSKSFEYDFEDLIIKNTVISRKHLTPELKLRLITPECEVWNCKSTELIFPQDPFWGIYWPGGQALGRYILDNESLFYERTVLDIGSGCGACALAAAKTGAKVVLANDIDPISVCAIKMNSKLNDLKVHVCKNDLIEKDIDSLSIDVGSEILKLKWDVVLVGDLFYDSEFSTKLFLWLSELVKKNKLVLIGDPGRHAFKDVVYKENVGCLVKVAEYQLCDAENNGFSTSAVFMVGNNQNFC